MKKFLPLRIVSFSLALSLSTHIVHAQAFTDERKNAGIAAGEDSPAGQPAEKASVGKEIPVPGAILFVPAAEAANMERQKAGKTRRNRKVKRTDRREVTQVIGRSVNTYLANVYNVHTLQRF